MYMTELADSQEVSTAAATGIVDRMELRGVVRRDRPKEDRRKVYVELTEKGRVVLREILAAAGLREDSDLADISDRGDLSDSDGADEIPEEMAGAVAGDPELERAPWERWGDL
ncbi:MAG: MarR family transcriptional regulator [Proteobacteria bacterium]|nr:MarR family transcriptional regulator [Pseudomonadota bacterium]